MQGLPRSLARSLRVCKPQKLAPQAVLRAGLSTSAASRSDDPEKSKKAGGLLKSILHGSEKAKQEAPSLDAEHGQASGQHSHLVGRGKYVHEVVRHKVKPGYVDDYKDLISQHYGKFLKTGNPDVKLTGSWEVVVGDLDTFYHIWEYEGLKGLDHAMPEMAASEEQRTFQRKLGPMLQYRTTQLAQEFSFWPSSPPKELGGIYEMRIYSLKPGSLLEWENEWKIGLEARRKFVVPIGAWFSQVGELHQVIHMWHYDSLEARKQMRQKAWEIDTWSHTVAKTVKLTNRMSAQILRPMPFSPLR